MSMFSFLYLLTSKVTVSAITLSVTGQLRAVQRRAERDRRGDAHFGEPERVRARVGEADALAENRRLADLGKHGLLKNTCNIRQHTEIQQDVSKPF